MPRTLAQNAQYIAETIKPAIKSAIEAQGVTVPSTDSFLDYADRIGEIEGGGSGYQLKDLPSGSISTVNDAAELPLNALKVSVEAVQDLHGYDHPWVGGAGKNKCDNSTNIVGLYDSTGYYVADSNYKTSQMIEVEASTTYSLSLFDLSTKERVASLVVTEWDANQSIIGQVAYIDSFTTSASTKYVRIRNYGADTTLVQSNNYAFQIELNSSPTSYEPYSNICPIIGWDSGEITVNSFNQWDEEWEIGSLDAVTGEKVPNDYMIRSKNYIPVKSNASYYIKYYADGMGDRNFVICYYGKDKLFINSDTKWGVITIPSNAFYMRFRCVTQYGTTYNHDISINYPATNTSYHAYQGKQYTLDFPQTIYGAEWDVVGGQLKVTDGYIASYNGESLPSTWISDRDEYASGTTPTIGAEVVFKLATPTTIDLSPLSIRMLEGTNNIFADCGEVIEGEYFVDEGAHRYQLYDYIESDGTQVIDLGFAPENGATVTTSFVLLSTQTSEAFVYGATDNSAWLGFAQNPASRNTIYENNTSGRSEAYIQNQQYLLTLTASRDYANHLCMFGFYLNGYAPGIKTRLCYCKYNDNFYLPAKRKSDGVFGLWDVANQTFLGDSAGGNPFVGGNPTGVEV